MSIIQRFSRPLRHPDRHAWQRTRIRPPTPGAPSGANRVAEQWSTYGVGALGLALLTGVVGWKLLGATYEADVVAICEAERRSGFALESDMARVTLWVRANVTTPNGNRLFSSLRDTALAARAGRLQSEASALHLDACPMVGSYQRLAFEAVSRTDVQQLCSWLTFPGFSDLDDDARLGAIEEWIDLHATSARTKQVANPLRRALPGERPGILRALARENRIFSCDLARTLDAPLPTR